MAKSPKANKETTATRNLRSNSNPNKIHQSIPYTNQTKSVKPKILLDKPSTRSAKSVTVSKESTSKTKSEINVKLKLKPNNQVKKKVSINTQLPKKQSDHKSNQVKSVSSKSALTSRVAPSQAQPISSVPTIDNSVPITSPESDTSVLDATVVDVHNSKYTYTPIHCGSDIMISTGTQTDLISEDTYNTERDGLLKTISLQALELESQRNQIEILEAYIQCKLHYVPDKLPPTLTDQTRKAEVQLQIPAREKFTTYIIGDSHVRGLSGELLSRLPKGCTSESLFHPGAGFQELAAVHSQSQSLIHPDSKDTIFVMCGTNDVCATQWDIVQRALDTIMIKFKHCSLVCIIGIPMRLDSKKLNHHIKNFNLKIKKYIQTKYENSQFIDTFKILKHKDFAVDGVHLNKGGKSKLCSKLKFILFSKVISPSTSCAARRDQQPLCPSPLLSDEPCPDLITLDDYEEDHYVMSDTQQHTQQESLPETSLLDTPIPRESLISTPLLANPVNYYRLTNISLNSFNRNTVHSSPNPVSSEISESTRNFCNNITTPRLSSNNLEGNPISVVKSKMSRKNFIEQGPISII